MKTNLMNIYDMASFSSLSIDTVVVFQLLSHVHLFMTPWTAA